MARIKAAVIGSGNIGTDLFIKSRRTSEVVDVIAMVGIDPQSDGLALAQRLGVATTAAGVDGLVQLDEFAEVEIVFDATSAGAHRRHDEVLRAHGKRILDLTPAAIGPYVVPPVNLDEHLDAPNINMVTCGGQATVPMIDAVNRVAPVEYGEIVSSVASRSPDPGRGPTSTSSPRRRPRRSRSSVAPRRGKAIIILNPAEPPLIMRNTVFCLVQQAEPDDIANSVHEMVEQVRSYVPGYRLKQDVQFDRIDDDQPLRIPEMDRKFTGWKVSVFLEVEGAGHYLPPYAGNLDIMTSAAIQTAEEIALRAVLA